MAVNPRLIGVAAFVVAAGLVGGATVAFVNAGDEDDTKARSPLAGATPSPSASPTPEATVEPTPEPTPSPTATASATPAATASASPSATTSASPRASASSSPATTTYAYPKPTRSYDGLRAKATLDPGSGNTGTTFELTASGTDGDGEIYLATLNWGDGTSSAEASPQRCKTYPPLTSPPGAYQPSPDSATFVRRHTYAKPGTYTLTVQLESVNKDCKPNGPAKERSSLPSITVKVVAGASPSPTASPSPSRTP